MRHILTIRRRCVATRAPLRGAAVVLGGVLVLGGCAITRTPQRPAPGSDLAMPERPLDRLLRGTLQRCDTARTNTSAGSARDADPCRRAVMDTLARATQDSGARAPIVP